MTRNSKKIKPEAVVFTSPDGIKIQITQGKKLAHEKHWRRCREITDQDFRVISALIDFTNEGFGGDESRYGIAFPSLETLQEATASSSSGLKKSLKRLKTNGIVISMGADQDGRKKGGRNKVSEYWLPSWNQFGAVSEALDQSPSDKFQTENRSLGDGETGHNVPETGHSGSVNGSQSAPDSSYLHTSSHTYKKTQDDCAAGGSAGYDSNDEREYRTDNVGSPLAANDNTGSVTDDPFPPDAWERFLTRWPNKVALVKAEPVFRRLAVSGRVGWSEFTAGVMRYINNKPDTQSWMGIIKFIEERRWTDVYGPKPALREARQRLGAAI